MPDDQIETKRPNAPKAMGLDADASALQKLGKALSAAVKSRAFGRPDFAKHIMEASKLAGQINWLEVKENIERVASAEREKEEVNLRTRREKLLQAASAANWPMQQGGQLDRIDIFHLEYEGATAVVKIGGVVLERARESDGERLFARLRELRTALDQAPFHRDDFFKMLKEAHIICRFRMAGEMSLCRCANCTGRCCWNMHETRNASARPPSRRTLSPTPCRNSSSTWRDSFAAV